MLTLICVLQFPVNLSGDFQISSVEKFLPRTCQGVEGVVGEVTFVWVMLDVGVTVG